MADKPLSPLEQRTPGLREIRERNEAKAKAEREAREAAQQAHNQRLEKEAAEAAAAVDLRKRRAEKFREEQAGMLSGGEVPGDTVSRICLAVTVHFLRNREKESLDTQARRLGLSAATLQHYAEWGEAIETVYGQPWLFDILFWLLDDPRGKLPDMAGMNRSETIRKAQAQKAQPASPPRRFELLLANFQNALGDLREAYDAEGHQSHISTIPEMEATARLLMTTHEYTVGRIEGLRAGADSEVVVPPGDMPQ